MVTQNQVENDFVYVKLPKLKEVHGENKDVFQEEWKTHLEELVRERKIPNHAINQWKIKL
jgi:hypothetical protein